MAYIHTPEVSTRRASAELEIPITYLQRVMKKTLNLKPYRPAFLHCLNDGDREGRLQFCALMLNQINEQPDILDAIVWSNEANFKLSGMVGTAVFIGMRRTCTKCYELQSINQESLLGVELRPLV